MKEELVPEEMMSFREIIGCVITFAAIVVANLSDPC